MKSFSLILLLTLVALTTASGQEKKDSTIKTWVDSLNAYFTGNISAAKKTPFGDFEEAVRVFSLPKVVKKADATIGATSQITEESNIIQATLIGFGIGSLAGIIFWGLRQEDHQLDHSLLLYTATGATVGTVVGLATGISNAKDPKRN